MLPIFARQCRQHYINLKAGYKPGKRSETAKIEARRLE
jgi:hypothetical protein